MSVFSAMLLRRADTWRSNSSPAGWPERVVHPFEVVEIEPEQRTHRVRRLRLAHHLLEISNIKPGTARAILTTDWLRERLVRTALPGDPLDITLPDNSETWAAGWRRHIEMPLTPAGVLIPVMDRVGELTVLLTQRSADLKHHPGQVSFPGGRMEEYDADVGAAALRETHEEVGIEPRPCLGDRLPRAYAQRSPATPLRRS